VSGVDAIERGDSNQIDIADMGRSPSRLRIFDGLRPYTTEETSLWTYLAETSTEALVVSQDMVRVQPELA
jgi:hypothetical protein